MFVQDGDWIFSVCRKWELGFCASVYQAVNVSFWGGATQCVSSYDVELWCAVSQHLQCQLLSNTIIHTNWGTTGAADYRLPSTVITVRKTRRDRQSIASLALWITITAGRCHMENLMEWCHYHYIADLFQKVHNNSCKRFLLILPSYKFTKLQTMLQSYT